jgi:hypothetical protein
MSKIKATKTASKTHGVFILDKSGSMAGLRQQVVTAFNEQVQQLRIVAATQPTFASLITFNADVDEVKWKEDIKSFPEATMGDYMPAGGTSLHDAMGHTLSKLLREDDGDTSYLVIVQSDGDTNSDRVHNAASIKELVQSCEAKGVYTIVYIGCDEAVIESVARSYGLSASNTVKYSTATPSAYGASSGKVASAVEHYATMRSCNLSYTNTSNFAGLDNAAVAGQMADYTADTPEVTSGFGLTEDQLKKAAKPAVVASGSGPALTVATHVVKDTTHDNSGK